ncbi:MAG: hypothetical protein ACLFRG_18420 [Desulfococcaceae bacterium]
MSGIPRENLYGGELENLLRMLEKGRIDAFWFERAATMTQLFELGIRGGHYRQMPDDAIPVGLAVARTPAGDRIKERLDALFNETGYTEIFAPHRTCLALPPEGQFTLDD